MKKILRSSALHLQKIIVFLSALLVSVVPAVASNLNSAVGFWKTIDPDTGKMSSIVKIFQNKNDKCYSGILYKIIPEGTHKASDLCIHCHGDQKNKPMLGLRIIRDMVFVGNGEYRHGHVLDPRNGKEYHAKMQVLNHGKTLKLRGYIGIPLFGKTAVWTRAQSNNI